MCMWCCPHVSCVPLTIIICSISMALLLSLNGSASAPVPVFSICTYLQKDEYNKVPVDEICHISTRWYCLPVYQRTYVLLLLSRPGSPLPLRFLLSFFVHTMSSNDEVPLIATAMQSSWLQSTRASTVFLVVVAM